MIPSEVHAWANALATEAATVPNSAELLICAPYTHLPALSEATFGTRIAVGAQDVSSVASGARTGEIAAAMLRDLGVTYVIIGHSERREYHGEQNDLLREKVVRATEAGLSPIFCVGETLAEREAGTAEDVVAKQLAAIHGLAIPGLVVAYEPVWAIGTGKTASAADANTMCAAIANMLASNGHEARVLYGGSMNPDNAAELLAQDAIQGGLIGGASLDVGSFTKIARSVQ